MKSKNKKGFTTIELSIILLVLLGLSATGYVVYKHREHKPVNSSSGITSKTSSLRSNTTTNTSNMATDDIKVEQDLASIGQAVQNLPFNDSGDPALVLPSKLSKMHVNLNYNITSYPYKILEDDGGEKNSTAVYEICANFNTSTINTASIDNYNGAISNPGASSSSYSLHSHGEQCFTNSITSEVNGVDLVPNSDENQDQGQIKSVSSQDWPTDSGFRTLTNLTFN